VLKRCEEEKKIVKTYREIHWKNKERLEVDRCHAKMQRTITK